VASALGVLKTPGEWGADIAVGDGQSLGIPMNFGGPFVGYMCTSKKLIRKMPGRIVGQTHDLDGKRTFVLTLQAREQHIRREKATSNICSNESLMALYITVYLALMGKQGLKEVNQLSYSGAHYLADRLTDNPHFTMRYPGKPFLNEFAVRVDGDIDALQRQLRETQGVQFGLKIAPDTLLLCVTETISKQDIDNVVEMCNHVIEREEIENE
jgi:glycine dehydrogenase subunit 1